MAGKYSLNLNDIPWPLSLLDCNRALGRLVDGDRLDIRGHDRDVFDNLVLIIKKAPVRLIESEQDQNGFKLLVEKPDYAGNKKQTV